MPVCRNAKLACHLITAFPGDRVVLQVIYPSTHDQIGSAGARRAQIQSQLDEAARIPHVPGARAEKIAIIAAQGGCSDLII